MLSIQDLSVQFSNGAPPMLNGISLDVRPGEILALLGRTGCGKSTVLSCIIGERTIRHGRILVDKQDITGFPAHRRADRVALVSQRRGAGIPGCMRVGEVIWTFARIRRSAFSLIRRSRENHAAEQLLRPILPQLCDRLDSQVSTLSAGEYQALSLACSTAALNGGPRAGTRVLLLDEHVAHLDSRSARFIVDLTRTVVQRDNLAAILVTHDLKLAAAVSDRSVILRDGRVVHDGGFCGDEETTALIYGRDVSRRASSQGDAAPPGVECRQ